MTPTLAIFFHVSRVSAIRCSNEGVGIMDLKSSLTLSLINTVDSTDPDIGLNNAPVGSPSLSLATNMPSGSSDVKVMPANTRARLFARYTFLSNRLTRTGRFWVNPSIISLFGRKKLPYKSSKFTTLPAVATSPSAQAS